MASYTIADEQIAAEQLWQYYTAAKAGYPPMDWTDLDLIFAVALNHRDRFPGIRLAGTRSPELYMKRWVKGYVDAVHKPPSGRTAKPKSTCMDPAIRFIVKVTQGLTETEVSQGEADHNLFMSAENILGNLLEEYIAEKIRPYGFLWCEGNVLHAIDFCNSDGTFFLQVKSKWNTENSSSKEVRTGTTIKKWYRLVIRTCRGEKRLVDKWSELNDLINAHRTQGLDLPPCAMSEEEYQRFLAQKAGANRELITCL